MCGIAGILKKNTYVFPESKIKQILGSMKHRGPDDEGVLQEQELNSESFNRWALFHTRLSINDLSTNGRNPISDDLNKHHIIFNGEIYNFKTLRNELKLRGIKFKTETDTEVILKLYLLYGPKFIYKIEGIFALAIIDEIKGKLIIARDKLGVKPLYYRVTTNEIIFSSEIRTLNLISNTDFKVDKLGFLQHFQFQNQLDETTLFSEVKIMSPAHYFEIDFNLNINDHKYWDGLNRKLQYEDIEDNDIEDAIQDALINQTIGDVEIGTFLSGGIDSTIISAIAASKFEDLKSFTVGFDIANVSSHELSYNELLPAKSVSSHLRIRNYQYSLNSKDHLTAWPFVVNQLEDLRVGPSVQLDFANQLAQQHVKVVLSGTGGDELFGGYPWRYPPILSSNNVAFESWFQNFSRMNVGFEISDILSVKYRAINKNWDSKHHVKLAWDSIESENVIDKALRMDMRYFLHGLLVVEDRLSMKNGVEVRVPFLDDSLVELAFKIDPSRKLKNNIGKIPLRQLSQKVLPANISDAKKQGFTPPLATWIANDYEKLIRSQILNNSKYLSEYFDMTKLNSMYDEHCNKLNHRMLFWSVISFEIWNRIFIGNEDVNEISEQFLNLMS